MFFVVFFSKKLNNSYLNVCNADLSKKVDFVIACELLLQDDDGVMMPAMVCGTHAEKFFGECRNPFPKIFIGIDWSFILTYVIFTCLGCTALELSKSAETRTRLREFLSGHLIRSGRRKKGLILKMVQKPSGGLAARYLVLS